MKTFFATLFLSTLALAYIPPTRVILEKVAENSGTSSYQIEKEIRFANSEIPSLKETWFVENDRTMKLIVTQPGIPQPLFAALYVNGIKYVNWGGAKDSGKVPEEMVERLFHFRKVENFIQYLAHLRILNSTQGNLDLSRLNRSQGVVNFGIGKVTEDGNRGSTPYLWIEQDTFVIKKIRYSEDTELTANNYQVYPKGLNYPAIIHLNWADQKVRMNTLSVIMVKKFQPTTFQSNQLEDSKFFQQNFSKWNAVTEFYKRFR